MLPVPSRRLQNSTGRHIETVLRTSGAEGGYYSRIRLYNDIARNRKNICYKRVIVIVGVNVKEMNTLRLLKNIVVITNCR